MWKFSFFGSKINLCKIFYDMKMLYKYNIFRKLLMWAEWAVSTLVPLTTPMFDTFEIPTQIFFSIFSYRIAWLLQFYHLHNFDSKYYLLHHYKYNNEWLLDYYNCQYYKMNGIVTMICVRPTITHYVYNICDMIRRCICKLGGETNICISSLLKSFSKIKLWSWS